MDLTIRPHVDGRSMQPFHNSSEPVEGSKNLWVRNANYDGRQLLRRRLLRVGKFRRRVGYLRRCHGRRHGPPARRGHPTTLRHGVEPAICHRDECQGDTYLTYCPSASVDYFTTQNIYLLRTLAFHFRLVESATDCYLHQPACGLQAT